MSTQKYPNSRKQWIQSNKGEYFGNITETVNVDLDSEQGVLKSAKKLTRVLDSTDMDESSESSMAITVYGSQYYLVTTDQVFRCSVTNDPRIASNWIPETTLGTEDLGLETDAVVFEGNLLISLGTDIMSWDGSTKDDDWWTTFLAPTLTALVPHVMDVVRSRADHLFVTDGNKVHYLETSGPTNSTVTLESHYIARALTASLNRMWVGTQTEEEQQARIFEIVPDEVNDAGIAVPRESYPIEGRAALAMFTYKNTPFVITNLGYIQVFDGAGFTTVAQFPWADESTTMNGVRPGRVQMSMRSTAIHPNGVKITGKSAYIFVDAEDEYGDNNQLLNEGLSGVWVLDLETYSLSHKYSLDGSVRVAFSGPLFITNTPETRVMVGTDVSGPGLYLESEDANVASVTLARHEVESIADTFEKLVTKTDSLADGSTITLKYRNTRMPNLPLVLNDVTWASDTEFTTTADTTVVEKGYEVFVEFGQGAGQYAHITNVTRSTNTTKITVDTAIGSAGQTSDVRVDNFLVYKEKMTEKDLKDFGGNSGAYHFAQYKLVFNGPVCLREAISKSNNKEGL